ncbi:hypothetical protein [Mucilaginibacter pedocola]|uniref:Glycoside hydrolase n=1 Tax=Mucilaginibacter pedocola TaxID=1792845 RepID=A0A1S9P902_9SPHI|nr:hypothetical protein [Mucilaginibacter pedocola]OOQ57425.1 hypothetical protein BC343_15115 [Mucilaginibacter pedocola]
MRKKRLASTIFFIFCFAFCFAALYSPSGDWSGHLVKDDGTNYPLNYHFVVNESVLTGTAKSELGEFPIDSGKVGTGGFSFKVTVNGLDINHSGKFYQDSVGLDIELNGAQAHCTLHRNEH